MTSIKLLGAGLISAFLIAAPILSTRQALPTAEVTLDVQRESVNVFGLDGEGSGVLFHRFGKTYVLTAAHVIEGIAFHDFAGVSQGDQKWNAVVINADANRDLALLRVDAIVGQPAIMAEPSKSFPVGTHLLHVGNTLGLNGSYLEGQISALGRFNGEFTQSSILCYPGSSGGGIFLSDGTLIGILTRGAGPGINFFIPHNLIWRWAVENDLQWLFAN